MMIKLVIALFCGLFCLGEACGPKPDGSQPASSTLGAAPAATTAPAAHVSQPGAATTASGAVEAAKPLALDACSLINKSEIAAIQGGQVQSIVPTHRAGGEFAISQCYYTVVSADGKKNLSVHLQVIQADPKISGGNAVRNFWKEKFERRGTEDERERAKGEGEEEEGGGKPLPISGLGDEAMWFGDGRIGALYVLKKDKLVRVSVGGQTDERLRIEKSKTLAAKALKRLA